MQHWQLHDFSNISGTRWRNESDDTDLRTYTVWKYVLFNWTIHSFVLAVKVLLVYFLAIFIMLFFIFGGLIAFAGNSVFFRVGYLFIQVH